MVGPHQLAAVGAFDIGLARQAIVRTPLIAPGARDFLFWNCHWFFLSASENERRFLLYSLNRGNPDTTIPLATRQVSVTDPICAEILTVYLG